LLAAFRSLRLACAIPALLLLAVTLSAPAQSNPEEPAVRAAIARETAAWTRFDPHAVALLYTDDAIWQNPFGVRIHGPVQLERFLTNLFNRPGYRSAKDTSPAKIIDLRFPSPTVAIVWSKESSEGQVDDSTGKPMAPRQSHYMEVLVKRDGQWKISDCLIMDVIPPS